VVLLALAGAAWLILARSGPSSPADLIAILPFEIAGSDPSTHTFAENVADQVSGALVKSDLTVISPDTGAPLDGQQRKAAAASLGAGFLLDGRVQGDGRSLQVNVHLDDLRHQGPLWSASFNRPVDQAQAMQEEVATKVAGVLHCALHVRDADGDRIDRQTLGLYLRACDVMQDSGAQDQAMDLLKQVVARQPRFAHAWSDLAVASELATDQLPPDRARQAFTEARAAAERALQLDPKDGDAYAALSDMVPEPGHWAERNALLLKGLSLDPDNSTLEDREAGLLEDVGRLHEALEYAQRSFSLDPLSPNKATALAFVLAHNGRLDEARVVLEKAARTWPDNPSLWEARMSLEAREGDPDRALAMLDDSKSRPADWEAARVEPWRRLTLARKSGAPAARDAFAREELAILRAGKTTGARAILMLNNVGRPDAAFEAVAWATAQRVTEADPGPLFRPEADGMRRDPRFMPLADKLGVVDFWRSSGKWPDFCEAPDLPYDCRAAAASLKTRR
jgi:TolB-like protein/Tfp pilus assembly protein PilF